MKLTLHPDAMTNFNAKAELLLNKLTIINLSSMSSKVHPFEPDHVISSTITEKEIIGDIIISSTDLAGNENGRFFAQNKSRIGLTRDSYQDLLRLSENMQRTSQLSPFVSVSFLKNEIFNWMKDKYLGITHLSMIDYVLNRCDQELKPLEIWIPIAEMSLQSDLNIGNIVIKTITKDVLDRWIDQWGEDANNREQEKKDFLERYQKKLQGFSAATIKLNAEPGLAFEIAVNESERALSILRIFSPAMVHPSLNSYITLLGKEHIESYIYFTVNNMKLLSRVEGLIDKSGIGSELNNETIAWIKANGLDQLSEILARSPQTKFEEEVLESIFIYSRCPLARDVSDKLIYILVAIESILLKDENEAIKENIGRRMGYLIGNTVEQRKNVIDNITKTYRMRSKFIHHGQRIEDMDTLLIFMRYAWMFFQVLIKNISKFSDKKELIDKIEDGYLSGFSRL